MEKGEEQSKSANLTAEPENKTERDYSGIYLEPENKQSELGKRTRGALFFSNNKEKAGVGSSHGEENKRTKRPLGFACPECSDFELDLAKDALKFFEDKKEGGAGKYEIVQVLAVCFAYSWPVQRWAVKEELCHISFSAKPRNNGDFCLKWFFAEFSESGDGVFRVTRAQVLDPNDSELKYGCEFCPPLMLYPHPPSRWASYKRELCRGCLAVRYRHRHKRSNVTKQQQVLVGSGSRDSSGIDPEPENKESELGKRTMGAFFFSNYKEKAGVDSSYGEENKRNKRPLWFACPECSDFELDLAKDALKFLEDKKEGAGEYEVVQVLAACFAYSWPEERRANKEELCHISFSAKPRNNGDFCSKWFFAEFSESGDGVFRVTRAQVLDPNDSALKYGCEFCPPLMLYPHPPSGPCSYKREFFRGRLATQYRHWHKGSNVTKKQPGGVVFGL